MNKKAKAAAWVLAVLFGVIFIELLLVAPASLNKNVQNETSAQMRKKEKAVPSLQDSLDGEVSQTMQGVHVVEAKNDRREWELWSDIASTYKLTGNLALKTVRTKFFGKEDSFFLVKGNTGSVVSQSKNMFIEGDVETESSNGYTFSTDQMKYDSSSRELLSDSAVKVLGPASEKSARLILDGAQLRADLKSSTIHIEGGVSAKKGVNLNGRKIINIKAEKALLSSQTNEVSFSGDVFINIQGMQITGPSAKFKYKANTGQVAAIELDGGVRVSDYDKWATSEKVRIDLDKDIYIFNGSPKVVQENDELFGDEIIFQEGGKKVKVKNARVKVSEQNLGAD